MTKTIRINGVLVRIDTKKLYNHLKLLLLVVAIGVIFGVLIHTVGWVVTHWFGFVTPKNNTDYFGKGVLVLIGIIALSVPLVWLATSYVTIEAYADDD